MWSQARKKKDDEKLRARCDSFVVETNVHFPTDISLLCDAMRKVILLTANQCEQFGITGWRQCKHIIKKLKKRVHKIQKMKRSNSKDSAKKRVKEKKIRQAYQDLINFSEEYIDRAVVSGNQIPQEKIDKKVLREIVYYIKHAEKQIDQITRRVLQGKTIPHEEKVFSVFQPHTEWISKGKAGVPVELGLRVAIVEDHYGFILSHQVMEKQTDDQVAVPFLKKTKKRFQNLFSCSFDKGFHSKKNQEELKEILNVIALPRKGKRSKKEIEYQNTEEYISAKNTHSAVESAINALEVHGLDRCPDSGIDGFNRYVSLAVLSRNLQIIGAILIKQELRILKKQKQYMRTAA